jgi:hypothetical protein
VKSARYHQQTAIMFASTASTNRCHLAKNVKIYNEKQLKEADIMTFKSQERPSNMILHSVARKNKKKINAKFQILTKIWSKLIRNRKQMNKGRSYMQEKSKNKMHFCNKKYSNRIWQRSNKPKISLEMS